MKTNRTLTRNLSLLTLSVLALLMVEVPEASARIRVKASVHTPYGAVRISNTRGPRTIVLRHHATFRVTSQDKKMAKRLSRYLGVSRHRLLKLRRQGYTWNQIGRRLDVSRRVIRAARHQRSWRRFVKFDQPYQSCGVQHRGYMGRYLDD